MILKVMVIFALLWPFSTSGQANSNRPKQDQSGSGKSLKATEVMDLFINNLRQNYPHVPLVHKTILREDESLSSGDRLYSNVAVIDYHREGYFDLEADRMKLIHGQNEIHIDTLFEEHLYGGLAEIRKDIIKYPREFLRPNGRMYAYEIVNKSDSIYKVSFNPTNKKSKYIGHLFINSSDFALVRAEYTLSEYGLFLLNKQHTNANFSWTKINEVIEYDQTEMHKPYLDDFDRYHLAKITTRGSGVHHYWAEDLEVVTELTVTDTNRTTFFADDYYKINDNVALLEIDFKELKSMDNDARSISHSEIAAIEASLNSSNKEDTSAHP